MDSLAPLINVLVVLAVLSVAAERITNFYKLKRAELRGDPYPASSTELKSRERGILQGSLLVGITLAILVKADFFEIMTHLEHPWQTLGWLQVRDYNWTRSPAAANLGTVLYALFGCVVTGVGLGFGSKFWHDTLDLIFGLKERARDYQKRARGEGEKG